MSSFIALRKTFDLSSDSNTHLLVGRQNRAIPTATLGGAIVTTMKQHYDFIVDVQFDSQGGSSCQDQRFALGSLYQSLPEPTKPQCIFEGWYTKPIGGTKIDTTSRVELSTTILYAHWEYVQIDSDCTSYSVTTTSSYKKTGIYAASIADSSQPIYIDWGDGAVEKMTSSISQKSHTYKTTGNFTVKISNNIASFAPSYNNSTWYGTTSQNRYTFKGMISTGSKVTSLPTYAFYYCSAMTNIDFMETCWPTVTSLPHQCFQYCSSLTSIQGAKRFTSFGSQCFRYCSGLSGIQDLSEFRFTTLPNSYTFANCTNVTQWILPSGFNGTSFGSYMFSYNNGLVSVGNIEKTINQNKAVQIEYLESTGTQWINLNVDQNKIYSLDFEITPLQNKYSNYATLLGGILDHFTIGWQTNLDNHLYIRIRGVDIAVGQAGSDGIQYTINEKTRLYLKNGILYKNGEKYNTRTFSSPFGSSSSEVYLFSGVNASRPSSNFYCHSLVLFDDADNKIRDLIPVRVGNVGYMYDKVSGQLFGNSGTGNFILGPDKTDAEEIIIEQETLTSKLPESLTSTGTYTFQNCSNLNSIIIPSKVQSIGNHAFYGCTSLSDVSIEATGLTAINQYAFYNCLKLTGLDLPDAVKTIGNYAFYGCTSLDYAGRMANDLPYDAEIEYLESDGTQYINTEISVETEGTLIQDYIVTVPSAKSTRQLMGYSPQYSGYWGVTVNGYYELGSSSIPNSILGEKDHIVFEREIVDNKQVHRLKCNSELLHTKTHDTVRETGQIQLFALRNGYKCSLKMYMSSIVLNDVCVRNFIPVRVGNVGYMYDKVSGQLFGNSGTGNFILGPDVKTKELPSQLTSIGSYAYQGCNSLKSLGIPENLQTIGDYAFAGCYQISSIVDKRLSAQTVSTNTFGSATGTSNTAFTGYQTRGSNILSTYFAATGYDENVWNDPLQNPDKCGFVQQYIDPENVVYHTVTFDAGIGSIQETSRTIVKGKKIGELPMPAVTEEQVYFCGWSTVADDVDSIIYKDYKVTSDMTLYAVYSSQPIANYEVILNDQWQTSSKTNPDPSKYDGVYESFSNYNIGSKVAVMYIKIKECSSFTIYIRSNAESSYDYTIAFNLDTYTPSNPLTSNPSLSTSGVKAHTSGKQNSGTAIGSYTKVEYAGIDGNEHYICVAYRKNGSVNSGDDRGYVLVEKQGSGTFEPVKYITVNFEVGDGTLVSGEATITDIQGTTISKFPEISAPASRPYFVGWNTQADGNGEYYSNATILPNQESLTLYACYVAEDPNKGKYLCFTAEQANSTIQLSAVGTAPTVYLETSRTCGNVVEGWSDFVVGETTITLDNVGDTVYFRAKQDNNVFAINSSNYNKFVMTGKIAALYNINTLLKADGSVVDLSGRNYCYQYMFRDCTSLTKAPELPATTLAIQCYYYMFANCTSLIQAPELPATTLATRCYSSMFRDCTSLTQAPELPATTLAITCYSSMFRDCTSLTKAPELPATTLAIQCYYYMFANCTSLIQAPELPATTLANYCYYGMLSGCTSLTKAPELPATTLASNCYYGMFSGCTSLDSINVNFSAWNPSNATTNWTSKVSSSGTFTCPSDLPETYGTSYIPANWEIVRK